jgi:chromosomal replication initiation ATPase DnaA
MIYHKPLSSQIIDASCAYHGIDRATIMSKRRIGKAIQARMIALHLIEVMLNGDRPLRRLSTTWLGNLFNRDPATVRHALLSARKRLDRGDPATVKAVAAIRAQVEISKHGGADAVRPDRAGAGNAAPG